MNFFNLFMYDVASYGYRLTIRNRLKALFYSKNLQIT